MHMQHWQYQPEFTKTPNGDIVRGDSPKLVHANGTVIDLQATNNLAADMLDAEGKHAEADDVRAMAAGDIQAFCRLFNFTLPDTCVCGSGLYPWWQPTKSGRVRVCDRCMRSA